MAVTPVSHRETGIELPPFKDSWHFGQARTQNRVKFGGTACYLEDRSITGHRKVGSESPVPGVVGTDSFFKKKKGNRLPTSETVGTSGKPVINDTKLAAHAVT